MKKILKKTLLLGICGILTLQSISLTAFSAGNLSGVSLKGVYQAYNEIGIGDLKGKSLTETYSAEWSLADSKEGEYALAGADSTYFVKASDAGKWLKAKVTVGEESYETEPKQIEAISAAKTYDGTKTKIGTNEKTPEEYKFTVDGVEFILLDVTDDDDSKFLVMTNKRIGVRRYSYFIKYSTEAGYDKSKNNTNNSIAATAVDMAAFLNDKDNVNVIIGDGEPTNKDGAWKYGTTGEINGDYSYGASPQEGYSSQTKYWTQLPSSIKSHINNDKYWICEPLNGVFEGNTFAIQGGIMPLSQSEVKKYSERIGLWEEYDVSTIPTKLQTTWWTRSPSSGGATYAIEFGALGKSAGRVGHTNGNGGCGVRPAFYLDKDFFLETEIDTSKAGDEVKAAVKSAYSKSEMLNSGLYTKDQLEAEWGYGSDLSAEAEYQEAGGALKVNAEISCEVGSYTDFIILCTVFDQDGRLIAVDAQKKSVSEGDKVKADTFEFDGISAATAAAVKISLADGESFAAFIGQTAAVQKN